jgi:hypothetical protein
MTTLVVPGTHALRQHLNSEFSVTDYLELSQGPIKERGTAVKKDPSERTRAYEVATQTAQRWHSFAILTSKL